jgi:hypothetical protein
MGSRHVVATRRGNVSLGEERSGLQSSWGGGGYPIMDPAAIPPPGFSNQQRAGVLVTQHSLLQVDVVFTALRIISNNIIKMGDLWAYKRDISSDIRRAADSAPVRAARGNGHQFAASGRFLSPVPLGTKRPVSPPSVRTSFPLARSIIQSSLTPPPHPPKRPWTGVRGLFVGGFGVAWSCRLSPRLR